MVIAEKVRWHFVTRLIAGLLVVVGAEFILPGDRTVVKAQTQDSTRAESVEVGTDSAQDYTRDRFNTDLVSVSTFRPGYTFWQNVFMIPDGHIIFGSAEDGRLLATFPTRSNWSRSGLWEDVELEDTLAGERLSSNLRRKRERVVELLEPAVGSLIHNPTRGRFLLPNAERYGAFLEEWGRIYNRFGVPAQIGLAQAILESGLNGRARSRAGALGLCQWLRRNWSFLNRLDPNVIEAYNQTTQASYCAAHLTILSTMYGSFIPALSEHHAGGVNVGRVVMNGERLGGSNTREQYLLGAQFARDLRQINLRRYRLLYRTYGLRSFLYTEMVFGNTVNVDRLIRETEQEKVFAMRAERDLYLRDIVNTTGLTVDEVKRFNPALVRKVPKNANLYLPWYVPEFGQDVSFWHQPASGEFLEVLNEFVRLDSADWRWYDRSFVSILESFQDRFLNTDTEEGTVMSTTLAYIISNLRSSRRGAILEEYRSSDSVLKLFDRGVNALEAASDN
tara:strand:- start:13385 stop:14899 length:1515 start_codon:yes stop_codon:yes gene_type:complete